MRLALLAVAIMLVVAIGIFIGLTGFQQYTLQSSRSLAGQTICAPDSAVAAAGRPVAFSLSGISAGIPVYWSALEGRTQISPTGQFSAIFSNPGIQTVSAFIFVSDNWARISCNVSVR